MSVVAAVMEERAMAVDNMPGLFEVMGDAAEESTSDSGAQPPEAPADETPVANDDMSSALPGLAMRPLGVVGN